MHPTKRNTILHFTHTNSATAALLASESLGAGSDKVIQHQLHGYLLLLLLLLTTMTDEERPIINEGERRVATMALPTPPPLPGQPHPHNDNHPTASQSTHLIPIPSPDSAIPTTAQSTSPTVPSSVLNLYLGVGATLLTIGVALGIRLGNRQAAQLERDNPPPPATTTTARTRQPPPITPQQRKAAFRATIGALGLGTVLCAGFGGMLVYGMGRYWGVADTKEFAVRMDSVVADQRKRWLGSVVS